MRLFSHARDPLSSLTHFIGFLLSVIGTLFMIVRAGNITLTADLIFSLLFCISLVFLYGSSSIYHFVKGAASVIQRFRKLDHSMIYVLIAGSYTPLLYAALPSPKNIYFISAIWAIALAGIVMKVFWMNAPRKLSTALYIIMGWFIIIDFPALKSLPLGALVLLSAGGVLYTIGGIIYAIKKPNISEMLGFHEIFHIFVILGSLCHYFMVFIYLV